ncbi:vasoactive intestinal polypeptide receptor 2 [Xenopus laevis]|uniref:Vasoactive intestinal polypeptide receptor 2 n=1 Tax=Xenopus laevis TaxID=8355 RepID=A0A8J1L2T8_XENLA|nr:vasoactive intestinal polypeptide receptor 2 [Xenopus laevis]
MITAAAAFAFKQPDSLCAMEKLLRVLVLMVPLLFSVQGFHPECRIKLVLKQQEMNCMAKLKAQESEMSSQKGCIGVWDNITCWETALHGENVTQNCPVVLRYMNGKQGNISRTCTPRGWTEIYPDIFDACGYNENATLEPDFYIIVKAIYTFGHSVSLIALTVGSTILCLFRKLHCTRNYIHLNLFISFILKAISVLVKDDFLFSNPNSCSESLIGCKMILVFLQYCVMANFYWLLVEGLYLQTLLVMIFSPNRHFTVYLLIGWGIPTIFIIVWIISRIYLDDTECWDTNDHSVPWWIIRIPIIISITLNFCLFINIIRILIQKLRSPDVGGNDQSQFKRLTKSTLLLIPLFGVHYMVFTVFHMPSFSECQIWFELCVGSFQGLVVVILYCFLNTEVQGELKRKWRSWDYIRYKKRDKRMHSFTISHNGSESAPQFHRNSRAQSILQTETTVI